VSGHVAGAAGTVTEWAPKPLAAAAEARAFLSERYHPVCPRDQGRPMRDDNPCHRHCGDGVADSVFGLLVEVCGAFVEHQH